MAIVNVRVERPSGVAFPAGARPRLRLWLPTDAVRAGALVTSHEVVVDPVPAGGVDVDLVPSTQLTGPDSRPVLWNAAVDWLDPDGQAVPGGHAEWGGFFIPESGGSLASLKVTPAGFGGRVHFAADMTEAETASVIRGVEVQAGDIIFVPAGDQLNYYRKDA